MAATASRYIELAKALPPRLQTFLARYPPAAILSQSATGETPKTGYQQDTPNPFLPTKHPVTGRWHDPIYSKRRQADLVKMAREHGVEELLPYTPKKTEEKLRKRVELGVRVKGTGVGQKVKGHIEERHLIAKYVISLSGLCGCDQSTNICTGWRSEEKRCWEWRSSFGTGNGYASSQGRDFSLMRGATHANRCLCRRGQNGGRNSQNKYLGAADVAVHVLSLYTHPCMHTYIHTYPFVRTTRELSLHAPLWPPNFIS